MNYDIFVSDFDGTLIGRDGTVSKHTVSAIARYRAAGGIFAVCTGRMLVSILPRLQELGLKEGVVIAYQGATIADIRTGALLKNEGFSREEAGEVIRTLEEGDFHIHVYSAEKLYSNRRDNYLAEYERVCGVKGEVPDVPLSVFVERENIPVVKTLLMCSEEEQPKVLSSLRRKLGEKYFVTRSNKTLVEIMPKGQTKASAIGFLSERFGVPKERIAAIGDEENDLPMLEAAGGKFAVEGAVEVLKKVACVVPSAEEDGVAYAIEKYAMGEDL